MADDPDKVTKSLYLGSDVVAYLEQPGVNASGTVNQAVRNQIAGGGHDREMLRLRRDHLVSEMEHHEQALDRIKIELGAIEERLNETSEHEERVLAQANQALSDEALEGVNPAIENWAGKVDMAPKKFLERLREIRDHGSPEG